MKVSLVAATLFAAILMAGNVEAQVSPIDVTGWNHDLVINDPAPYNLSVTGTMDGGLGQVENQAWVEEGYYTVWNGTEGVPNTFVEGLVAGTHSSLTGNGTFAFQSFTGNNAVGLDGGQSGTLTLTTPAAYKSIALYGASGFGSKTADVLLTFADSSTSLLQVANGTGIGTDWFNTSADKAFEVKGRASNKSEEGYTILFYQQNDIIGINESFFALGAAEQSKLLTSVTITNTGGDRMAVFAISGQQVPEPASLALVGLCGLFGIIRRPNVK
jgi:hypothetical protein